MFAKYVIADPIGLHARPLSLLVKEVSKYDVPMFLHYEQKRVPMHSLMMLMSLGVPHQGEITIEVESEDAATIHTALKAVMLKEGLIKPT